MPYEEQAYTRDARYTKDPSDCFSMEGEVREWLRSGRFQDQVRNLCVRNGEPAGIMLDKPAHKIRVVQE